MKLHCLAFLTRALIMSMSKQGFLISDDIFNLSVGRCFFGIVKEDCERTERHSGLSLVLCRCGEEIGDAAVRLGSVQ